MNRLREWLAIAVARPMRSCATARMSGARGRAFRCRVRRARCSTLRRPREQLPTAIPQTKFVERAGHRAVLRRLDPEPRRHLRSGLRLLQPQLAGGARDSRRARQHRRAGRRPIAASRRYFLPRRQGWVFRVRVPKDFGKQVLTWTIKANGKTQKAYGELLPVEEITERIVMTRGNLNPGDERSEQAAGDCRSRRSHAAAVGDAGRRSTATVTDDGLPKPRVPVAAAERRRPTRRGFRRRRIRRPSRGRADSPCRGCSCAGRRK